MKKIGRNDACPCGSGKKYKKCCLLGNRKPAPVLRQKLESSREEFGIWMSEFLTGKSAENLIQNALDEFLGWPEEQENGISEDLHPAFVAWFLSIRELHPGDLTPDMPGSTIVEAAFAQNAPAPDEGVDRLARQANRAPFSFHILRKTLSGGQAEVEDLLGGGRATVTLPEALALAEVGTIFYARIIGEKNSHVVYGHAAILLPEGLASAIDGLRQRISGSTDPVTRDQLIARDALLRNALLSIRSRILVSTQPEGEAEPSANAPNPETDTPEPAAEKGSAAAAAISALAAPFLATRSEADLSSAFSEWLSRADLCDDLQLDRGNPAIWASGVLCAAARKLGHIAKGNAGAFSIKDVCEHLGTNAKTVQSKTRAIEVALG